MYKYWLTLHTELVEAMSLCYIPEVKVSICIMHKRMNLGEDF